MSSFVNLFFRSNKTAFVCCLSFACLCGAVFRFEQWFDFFNYHYYNVWAFFNGRNDIDVAPAFINTFFSPFADIPVYGLINALNDNPVVFSAVMAVPYGLMLFIVYKTAAIFFSPDDRNGRVKIIMTLLLCVCSTNIASQISTTTNDLTLSVFVLAAGYLLLKAPPSSPVHENLSGRRFSAGRRGGIETDVLPVCRGRRHDIDVVLQTAEKSPENNLSFFRGGSDGFFDYLRILGLDFMEKLSKSRLPLFQQRVSFAVLAGRRL